MHRIDGAGHVGNMFVAEDPATSRPPTEITATWMNAVQEEIANVIAAAGLNLSAAEDDQLVQAIAILIANSVTELEAATEAAAGNVELATIAETIAGIDGQRATHPAGVKAAINAAAVGYALRAAINSWTKTQAPVGDALVDGAVINWDGGSVQVAKLTISGNRTMAEPTNVQVGALYMLRVTQDGTGSRLLAWNSAFKFGASGAPTLTATAGKTDFLSFLGGAGNTLEFIGARLNGV